MPVKFNDINILFKKLDSYHYCLESSVTPIDNDFLGGFVKSLKPAVNSIIEIGTFNGLSTIILASISKLVFTFDVAYRNNEYIWSFFPKLRSKINCCVGPQEIIDDTIGRVIRANNRTFNINFAFIDGMHKLENVKHDFELVRFCGRVLFHDADMPHIASFIKEIGGKVFSGTKFGYWQNM